jgi:hypothetical protein
MIQTESNPTIHSYSTLNILNTHDTLFNYKPINSKVKKKKSTNQTHNFQSTKQTPPTNEYP